MIYKATADDIECLSQNNILLAKESEQIDLVHSTVVKGVKAVVEDSSKGFYLVAKNDEEILGQLLVTYEWSDWRNQAIWWIQSVFIQQNFRKKGIFTMLLETIFTLAKKENVNKFRLYVHNNNIKARKTYTHMHMKKTPYNIYEFTRELFET
jgi:GNAT superfamily N-acetyltransferase